MPRTREIRGVRNYIGGLELECEPCVDSGGSPVRAPSFRPWSSLILQGRENFSTEFPLSIMNLYRSIYTMSLPTVHIKPFSISFVFNQSALFQTPFYHLLPAFPSLPCNALSLSFSGIALNSQSFLAGVMTREGVFDSATCTSLGTVELAGTTVLQQCYCMLYL